MKKIRIGDVIWLDTFGELIEVVGILNSPRKKEIHYWSSERPEQVETRKCSGASPWIIFENGIVVGTTRPTHNNFRAKVGLK